MAYYSSSEDSYESNGSYGNKPSKRALLVGASYIGRQPGEINNEKNNLTIVYNMLLDVFEYKPDDIVILHEAPNRLRCDYKKPSQRKYIISELTKMVNESETGDQLFFYFSGHGTSVEDEDGDEDCGFDQAICPSDNRIAGNIIDDELYVIVSKIARGARLMSVFDSCNAGSALDLPFMCKVAWNGRRVWYRNRYGVPRRSEIKHFATSFVLPPDRRPPSPGGRRASYSRNTFRERFNPRVQNRLKPGDEKVNNEIEGRVFLFAASHDTGSSLSRKGYGMFTKSMVTHIRRTHNEGKGIISYSNLLYLLEKETIFLGHPRFSASHLIDIDKSVEF